MRRFLRCFATKNPRASGEVLLYFLAGVSSVAYTEVRTIRAPDEQTALR